MRLLRNPKRQVPGVSLLMVLVITTVLLGMVLLLLTRTRQSSGRLLAAERAVQNHYLQQSATEAGLFHTLSRGGTARMAEGGVMLLSAPRATYSIGWQTPPTEETTLSGTIPQYGTLRIPLYAEESQAVSDTPMEVSYSATTIRNTTVELSAPASDYGSSENEVLLDWYLTRRRSSDGQQEYWSPLGPLPPEAQDTPCTVNDGQPLLCESALVGGQYTLTLTGHMGVISPCNGTGCAPVSIEDFIDPNAGRHYALSLRSVLPYYDSTSGDTISGIPYSVHIPGEIPFSPLLSITQGGTTTTTDLTRLLPAPAVPGHLYQAQ